MALSIGRCQCSHLLGRSALRLRAPPCGLLPARTPLLPPPACASLPLVRPYSAQGGRRQLMVLGVPNPLIWLRTRVYYFLIRAYFDQEFSIREFSQGARQAFAVVSKLLSQCNFDELKELVGDEVLQGLKEKCSALPESHKKALAAESEEIMYLTPGDVGIYYDDNGRKFVSILMRFWYLTSANLPEDSLDGAKVLQIDFGEDSARESKRLLTANYEFRREFTKGAAPNWIITRIEHSNLLD